MGVLTLEKKNLWPNTHEKPLSLFKRTTLCNYNKIVSISLNFMHIPFQEEIPKHFVKSYKFILPESKINDLDKISTFQEQQFSPYPKY